MLLPYNENVCCPKNYLLVTMTVTYQGKSAHASTDPWEGNNALDAAVACYTNLAYLRQQLKRTWSVSGKLF